MSTAQTLASTFTFTPSGLQLAQSRKNCSSSRRCRLHYPNSTSVRSTSRTQISYKHLHRRLPGCHATIASPPPSEPETFKLEPEQAQVEILGSQATQQDTQTVESSINGLSNPEATTATSSDVYSSPHYSSAEEEELTTSQLIWRAVKPPLYSVAFIPLIVGAGAAYLQTGVFHPGRFWSFLFHSVLIIAWLNLSNDAFDAETGVDKEKKESVVNITGSRTGVLISAFALLGIGLTGLFRGALAVQDMRIFKLLAGAIFCGYIYQSPPFRLSYKGLGEPLCFIAFGPLATSAFYLYQASAPGLSVTVGPTALAASVLVGITTTLILFCSHFHQIEGDLSVGKMSPLVRLGTKRGSQVLTAAIVALYGLSLGFCALGALPLTCLPLLALTAPVAISAVKFVQQNHSDKTRIFMAKFVCTRLHIAFGMLLALGLALGRRSVSV